MKNKSALLRVLGGFLLLASVASAFLWFYWYAPFLNLKSSGWWYKHSPARHWEEAQKHIRRSGVDHDTGIALGDWGNKPWVEWIMKRIQPGEDIGGCGYNHLGDALAQMTNQQLEFKSDVWLSWWATNQHKSQVEWIREGFARRGITLEQPLTTNNIIALLAIISPVTHAAAVNDAPRHTRAGLRYNALRWLRDAGFNPGEMDVASVPKAERDMVTRGLVKYALWLGEHRLDPGKLWVWGVGSGGETDFYATSREEMTFRWVFTVLPFALAAGGILLLRLTRPNTRFSPAGSAARQTSRPIE